MKNKLIKCWASALMSAGAMVSSAFASTTFTFTGTTAQGNTGSAKATFSISGSTMTVTLTDLLQNPGGVANVLNGVTFSLAGVTGVSGFAAASVQIGTIAGDGSYTPSTYTALASQWSLSGGPTITLQAFPNPDYLILGPDANNNFTSGSGDAGYTGANSSIAGNPSHNPFVLGSATFTFTLLGSGYSESSITNVIFGFGTGTDSSGSSRTSSVPEPSTIVAGALLLLPFGVSTLRVLRRKQAMQQVQK
jgi:hypothetical protein